MLPPGGMEPGEEATGQSFPQSLYGEGHSLNLAVGWMQWPR